MPIFKTQQYTLDDVFEKNLLLLIPFYIFSKEADFSEYEADSSRLEALKREYQKIIERLKKRKQLLHLLCEGMNFIPETGQMIMRVLTHREWQDIEDALQMQCAQEARMEYIVTQNLKDFGTSEVKAICEEEFCEMLSAGL